MKRPFVILTAFLALTLAPIGGCTTARQAAGACAGAHEDLGPGGTQRFEESGRRPARWRQPAGRGSTGQFQRGADRAQRLQSSERNSIGHDSRTILGGSEDRR